MQKLYKEFRNEKDLFQFPEEWENDILVIQQEKTKEPDHILLSHMYYLFDLSDSDGRSRNAIFVVGWWIMKG